MNHLNLSPAQLINATGGGIDVDLGALTGPGLVLFTSKNSAGTNPTHARKLQGSEGLSRGYEYSTSGTLVDNELREGATTNVKLAVRFTQSGARQVKRVALRLKKGGTIAAGKKLTLTIESNNAGNPSGTALTNGTSATVDIDTEVSTTAGWVVFTFAKPVDLADATVYHFVLAGDYTASASNNVMWQSNTVASGGTLNKFDNTNWGGVVTTQAPLVYVDEYNFTDITGVAQTQGTASGAVDEAVAVYVDALPAVVRVYDTIGGTSSPGFYASAHLIAEKTHA